MTRVLVVATSRKTRGGITSVVKAHEMGKQWKEYHCKWIETHRDGPAWRKLWYFVTGCVTFLFFLPFSDLVHIHFSEPPSAIRKILFVYIAKLCHKKVVIHFHSFSPETTIEGKYKEWYRYLFHKADASIVLSKFWYDAVDKAFHDKEIISKVKVIYNPCMLVPRARVNLYQADNENNKILYAGTLNQRKGYVDLLKGFAKIAKKYPNWIVEFAGNGEIEKGKVIAKDLGIENQVHWLGWIEGEEKDRAFCTATVFCLPSYAEGFPMGVLDAFAYSLPVITTPVGGIPDVARDGENMLLFKPGDVDSLADCLERIMSDDKLRGRMAKESYQFANGLFSLNNCNRMVAEVYETVLNNSTQSKIGS